MNREESNKSENQESSDFHETDYYSKFQEQDGSLSDKREQGPSPADEIDEKTIQELMDAALIKKGKQASSQHSGEELDMTVREDWAMGAPSQDSTGDKEPSESRGRPAATPLKPMPRRVVGQRRRPRRRRSLFSTRRLRQYFRAVVVIGSIVLIGLVVYNWGVLTRAAGTVATATAAELHSAGKYEAAAQAYEELVQAGEGDAARHKARYAFLRGGACEQLWRKQENPEVNLKRTVAAYEEAVDSDRTELKVYAVAALLAKAEILVEEAHRREPFDADMEREGCAALATLIEDPIYKVNPAVHQGIPHRRLAQLTQEEDPETAIQLLLKARDSQGDLEEGLENLAVALIYRDLLDDPDRAEDFFDLVRQNELASTENRRIAERALSDLREGMLDSEDLYSYDVYELETFPETMEP